MRPRLPVSLIFVIALGACVKPPVPQIITPVSAIIEQKPTNTPYPTRTPIIVVPGNLLIDPSLEGPYRSDGIHPEVNTSYAWKAWYSCQGDQSTCIPPCIPLKLGCDLPCPSNCVEHDGKCQSDYGCYWARQEFNPIDFNKAHYRVHSGNIAQQIFTYGRQGLGGIRQTVVVTPGIWLKLTAYMQAWQCFNYGPDCDWGRKTDMPSNMHLRIGIDPTGGTVVTSTAIIWSPEQEAYDRWVEFTVFAHAQSNQVTVFTQGGATFDYARMNNDVYIDDANLVPISPLDKEVFLPLIQR